MESGKYFILVGTLLLLMAMSPGILRKLPFTSAIIYLLFGIALGEHGFDVIDLRAMGHSTLIEVISELTVITSLFTVGLKLNLDLKDRQWLVPISLATISMIITVAMIAIIAYYFLHLPLGTAILLGAIISPTDPVLASEVQLRDAKDHNPMRFSLTTEGGMNDGTAFPFVMLGLGLLATDQKWSMSEWLLTHVLWSISAGLLIGVVCGWIISSIARYVKEAHRSFYLEDFLTIASIALSYGIAIQVHSYGFLAVFANAFTIRQIEIRRVRKNPKSKSADLPDDVLSFNEQVERIFEVVSVGVVGLLIDLNSFSLEHILFPMVIFIIVRPIAIFIGTIFFDLGRKDRILMSWFGVRGIGSVYYLYFAINHGPLMSNKKVLIDYTLWTIVCSILVHSISVKPVLRKWK